MSDDQPTEVLFVIGGYNGLKSVEAWVRQLQLNSNRYLARTYSWRDAQSARRDIAALSPGKRATLVGHSLGGGQAELLVQQLPAGTIDILITVAPFGPRSIDHALTRRNVGYWLNIISAPGRKGWQDMARKVAAPLLLNWREQGLISTASENHASEFPHQDFYKMMTDRFGAVEHGRYRSIET